MPDSTVGTTFKPRVVPVPLSRTVTFRQQPFHFSTEQVNRLFWAKITRVTETQCWHWQGKAMPTGYGHIKFAGREWYTHRVSYELHNGPIPDGLHLDHLCRNRICCNPAHLEAVTCKENIHRSPVAPAAINARKTHCLYGHELTGANLLPRPNGERHCRTCARWRGRVRDAKAAGRTPEASPPKETLGSTATAPYPTSNTCRAGHPWTEVSTYIRPNGVRECRLCRSKSRRTWEEQRASEGVPQ
ncbi:HNH endonuclease signature motif containing protein [Streptomyces sp. NPDC096068]|uniref:HNH endonuclease signature motif containing protein n=1 Tax=Streptomyces sp. NPDC096068 TaxID=3155424 RepID=UPI00333407BC